ncbi:formyltetrahydrofolate deformylase [Kribbia dieselivorans]|uniref:formyltetrahydrofolate deformylase n=1 Tax=Kribbia dieselivorans TaxID=331526 RepID=UPI0009F8CB84|nr:formyltetrahydrofolate deformylase [Kribbia dieselivorans]
MSAPTLLDRPAEPGRAFILTVSCPDRLGIVHAVSGFAVDQGLSIRDAQQFGDPSTDEFHLRMELTSVTGAVPVEDVRAAFEPVAQDFGMDVGLHDLADRHRVLIMVSQQGHVLNDLLYRWRSGHLPVDIPAIVSNHEAFADLAAWHGIPFHHIPVTKATKPEAETRLRELIAEHDVDTVALARYMQILSPELCGDLAGRVINIHHSLLPSFKGAKPYTQAHDRGVKVIGATAHYVTADLDEGPIIEQDFRRVDHRLTPDQLATAGQELEAMAFARALTWHVEHRVVLRGRRTIVFN